jgi:dTDP-4-dehydrorhamnose reductase
VIFQTPYILRYPVCVDDAARVIRDIVKKDGLSGIFHFSSERMMSKYEMCGIFSHLIY